MSRRSRLGPSGMDAEAGKLKAWDLRACPMVMEELYVQFVDQSTSLVLASASRSRPAMDDDQLQSIPLGTRKPNTMDRTSLNRDGLPGPSGIGCLRYCVSRSG
jgi:hypothetical protein